MFYQNGTTACLYILCMLFSCLMAVTEPTFAQESAKELNNIKPEVNLYLEGSKLEKDKQLQLAADRYQEALSINPTFVLAQKRLVALGKYVLTDHRKLLKIDPGYSIKPSLQDPKSVAGPISIKDVMPGYLMLYKHPSVGRYGLFSLSSRHMHNVHYLFVKEDTSWRNYPSVALPGVTRVNDILVYHQPGEMLQEGFIQILINAFTAAEF